MRLAKLREAGKMAMNFRHWRLFAFTRVFLGFLFAIGLFAYSVEHNKDVLGVASFAGGTVLLVSTNIYVIRLSLRSLRRKQRLGAASETVPGKLISYEKFKEKRGVG